MALNRLEVEKRWCEWVRRGRWWRSVAKT